MVYSVLNVYLPRIFDWLLQTTIMASIAVGLILCVKVVLRNKLTPRWHYALWLILVVRLLLPWSPDSSYSIYSLLSPKYDAPYTVNQAEVQEEDLNKADINTISLKASNETTKGMSSNQSENQDTHHISMYQICLYVWLLGVFCLGMITLVVNNRVYAYIKKQPIVTDERILTIFENCKKTMSIKRDIPLFLAGKISSPTLLGFRKPRILLCEKHIQKLDDNQLRYIFSHELAHFKRKDVGINWLMHSLLILNWFNPILWYAYYAMREDQEMACDALALTFIGPEEQIEYGHTIITLLEHYSNYYQMPSLANLSRNKRTLKRRIMMIKKFNKKSYRLSVLGLVTVLGVSTFSLVNAKAEENNPQILSKGTLKLSEKQKNKEPKEDSVVIKDGTLTTTEKQKNKEPKEDSVVIKDGTLTTTEKQKNEESKEDSVVIKDGILTTTEKQKTEEKIAKKNLKEENKMGLKVSHILVKDEKTAKGIEKKLKNNEDFAALAKQYSEDIASKDKGGDLGLLEPGKFVIEIEDTAYKLKVGEVSEPVKSPYGYQIIKVTGKKN
ncbi:M56 family metallopeptidase [Bacillus sp. TH25]|nr:M56 family metallopeptidase [Bacillus sp. TH25]MBK5431506.1 peptidylprolyl isomerase [Bacillus sp. TH25]